MAHRNLLVDVLAALFGVGAWVAINGLWVELPLLVEHLPERWNLPSYLAVIIQIANIGPLVYTLLKILHPSLRPDPTVYFVLALGSLASLLLTLFWDRTSFVAGANHSTALLILVFFLSLVDCTSSVLFLPYMAVWRRVYLPSYLVGEGLSGLLPGLVALIQGVGGNPNCVNMTLWNVTDFGNDSYVVLVPEELEPRFSVTTYFFFLFAMMIISALAFALLQNLRSIRRERVDLNISSSSAPEVIQTSSPTLDSLESSKSISQLVQDVPVVPHRELSTTSFAFLLGILGWACLLANGVLPSIQSYSCGPYGNVAYHLVATLAALANPTAAFLTLLLPRAKPKTLGLLALLGSFFGAYVLATAALSPAPPLVDTDAGSALVIMAWVSFTGLMTYVRVETANLMREDGASALFWSGAITQASSAVGAVTIFVLVNVCQLFTPYYPCG
ncbi:solute carrier family 52, riboflavin transporter, member 3-A-like isoform X2 [Oratosquilla oratoria]